MSHPAVMVGEGERASKRGWRRYLERVGAWLAHKDKGEWFKDMKTSVSLIASIIATMSFQLATNPPGGVVQIGPEDDVDHCRAGLCPGQAVLAAGRYSSQYKMFLMSNTICFVVSLSVCLLLVSGISLNQGFLIWLMSFLMCITLTSLTLTYVMATAMVTPHSVWESD
ncbi:PGG domain, partial [Sesbania bispinosa]